MNIFAIDLGNKRVKMKSGRGEYVYPASYIDAGNVATSGLGTPIFTENQIYQLPEESNEFIWGTALDSYNIPEKIIDTYSRTGRYTQKKAKRLLEFAIARLANDFPEAQEKPLKVQLVLGVSISDGHENSKVISILRELAEQKHRCIVNGVEVIVDIVGSESVTILPQFMGTVYNLAYDETMHEVPEYKDGRIGIIDIGGGTVLVSSANFLYPDPVGEERFEGIQMLIKEIAKKGNITKPFLIEELLRSGNKDIGYIYRPNRNVRDAKDITHIVLKAIENYTRLTIAPLITEVFPDGETVDFIVMTGGGSNLVDKEALRDEIGEDYFERLVFVEESEVANVRGFYKAGRLLWGEGALVVPETPREKYAQTDAVHLENKVINANDKQSIQLTTLLSNIESLNERMNNLYRKTEINHEED